MAEAGSVVGAGLAILAVDDKEANLVALERTLAGIPARIVRASSGEAALARAIEQRFALAIVDVQMPGMNGYELAELLLSDPDSSQTPIIFVSAAYADEAHQFEGYSRGAVDYLVKPYDPAVLRSKVKVFLELASHRHHLEAMVEERTRALRASEERYRRLYEDMRASEQAMRSLFQATQDGIVAFDLDAQRVMIANDAMRRMLGRGDPVVPGASAVELLGAQPLAQILEAVQGGDPRDHVLELLLARPDDSVVQVEASLALLEVRGQRSVLGVLRDSTERHRAAAEQQRLREELFHAQKIESVGLLAGGIAHDFNNLLSVILGYVGLVLENPDTPADTQADLEEIRQAGQRSAELTRQLLAFGRKQFMNRTTLDLNQVALGVEKLLRRIIGENIDLSLQLAPGVGLISADAGQLEQVIVNLAVNARDAMPQGGQLLLATSNVELDGGDAVAGLGAGRYVRLSVTDTGTGMDAATQARIFEPFFTTKPKGKGTGLGLASVHGIVAQSGGTVRVASELGRGSTFEVYLPRTGAAPEVEAAHPHLGAHPTLGGSETILVVEDEASVRALAERALGNAGYRVLTATDGLEGLRLCEAQPDAVALVLTDLVMPRMGGLELADRLAAVSPAIDVLFMSGYSSLELSDGHDRRVAENLLEKPFLVVNLLKLVRAALDRRAERLAPRHACQGTGPT